MVSRSLWPSLFSILASRCWHGAPKGRGLEGLEQKIWGSMAKAGKKQEGV